MQEDLTRPIFVLGVDESGAHLLQLILSHHPLLTTRTPARARRSFRAGNPGRILRSLERPEPNPWPRKMWPEEHFDCFAHPAYLPHYRLTEADVEPGDREALQAAYRLAMGDTSRRLVEYDPANLARARYLQALFPDATFVIVVRDPYANVAAASSDRSRWGAIEAQALHWSAGYEALLADRRSLKRRVIVRYEQFVTEPRGVLEAICRHCRVDFAPELMTALDLETGYNERLIGRLDQRDLRIITRACGRTMARLGYARRDKFGRPLPGRKDEGPTKLPLKPPSETRHAA